MALTTPMLMMMMMKGMLHCYHVTAPAIQISFLVIQFSVS
jgi:hypothetical protein